MAKPSTYLNFQRNAEETINFYKSVFGDEFKGEGFARFGDVPALKGTVPLSSEDKNLVMHVITGGHFLMGTEEPESMGFNVNLGKNIYIYLEPETKSETKKLFDALSAGGNITIELQDMFWGGYYGSCTDKFGVQWMINYKDKKE